MATGAAAAGGAGSLNWGSGGGEYDGEGSAVGVYDGEGSALGVYGAAVINGRAVTAALSGARVTTEAAAETGAVALARSIPTKTAAATTMAPAQKRIARFLVSMSLMLVANRPVPVLWL